VTAMIAIPSWLGVKNHKGIKRVTDNVVNGHATPMRADIDAMRATLDEVRTDIHGLRGDVADMRGEQRQERRDRLELDQRFEAFRKDH